MVRSLSFAFVFAAGMLPGVALAQAAPVPEDQPPPGSVVVVSGQTAQGSAQVQATAPRYTGPTGHIYGVPVRMDAPVEPPYAGTAYSTFGGQPETGLDELMSQQVTGQPK
jgi:hypothetical protein